jgi:hypothetical protein
VTAAGGPPVPPPPRIATPAAGRPPVGGGPAAAGGGIIRTIVTLILAGIGVLIGATLVGAVLAFTGSPAACADRVITPSAAASNELRTAWRQYGQQAASGNAQVTFTEVQVTSRGVEYIDQKDVPVDGLQVYFCGEGYAEASGEVSILGLKSKVVVRGTLDLTGDQPRIQIDEVNAGNLPSAVAKPVIDAILDTGNFRTLDIDEPIGRLTYTEGSVTVSAR